MHEGEYFVIWNPEKEQVILDNYRIINDMTHDTLSFTNDTLEAWGRAIVAFGRAQDSTVFHQRTLIPDTVRTNGDFLFLWQTALTLEDNYGTLRIEHISTTTDIDIMKWGETVGKAARMM